MRCIRAWRRAHMNRHASTPCRSAARRECGDGCLGGGCCRIGESERHPMRKLEKVDKGQHFSTFTMHPYNKHLD